MGLSTVENKVSNPAHSLSYVPLLGGMYESTEKVVVSQEDATKYTLKGEANPEKEGTVLVATRDMIAAARKVAGAASSDTFTGRDASSVSGKALAFLEGFSIKPKELTSVKFESIQHRENHDEAKDQTYHKALVRFSDVSSDARFIIVGELTHENVQRMVGKLAQTKQGTVIDKISMFGLYEKGKNDNKMYTNHRVAVKVAGEELAISPEMIEGVKEAIDKKISPLKAAGLDSKMITQMRRKEQAEFWINVTKNISPAETEKENGNKDNEDDIAF